MFKSVRFRSFRGFNDLTLDGLKGVNLIVGKNNSGKTSFLEGLFVIAQPTEMGRLPALLRTSYGDSGKRFFPWMIKDGVDEAQLEGRTLMDAAAVILQRGEASIPAGYNRRQISTSLHLLVPVQHRKWRQSDVVESEPLKRLRFKSLSVNSAPIETVVHVFAQAVKQRGGEQRIEKLLRQVDPRFAKIRVDPGNDGINLVVDIGLSEMVPLNQVGQGMYRLVSIFSELVGDQPDICVIDEIENGLHHSILEEVWYGVAAASRELGIQIYATTHSYECILAAHSAFCKAPEYDFSVIQLFRTPSDIQGRVLDRKHIEAAIAGEIDLR
jgi:hypothetical protein